MRYWKKPKISVPFKLGFVVATFEQKENLRCLLFSLLAQTYKDLKIVVIHDGPPPDHFQETASLFSSYDIQFTSTPIRENCFGHNCREMGLKEFLKSNQVQAIVFTNGDNYYVPTFAHAMVEGFTNGSADLVYSNCIHSHKKWLPMTSEMSRGKVDCGSFATRTEFIRKHHLSWGKTFAADWFFLESALKHRPVLKKVVSYLFVHN